MGSYKDLKLKKVRRQRRRRNIRSRVFGDAERPRLTVFRSHKNIYCQLIDDFRRVTLAAASTREKKVLATISGFPGNCTAARAVGQEIAEKAKSLGVTKVRFDRNGYRYHGRVKALAEAVRESGIEF
jgi:large subunit ribosomal protein L18